MERESSFWDQDAYDPDKDWNRGLEMPDTSYSVDLGTNLPKVYDPDFPGFDSAEVREDDVHSPCPAQLNQAISTFMHEMREVTNTRHAVEQCPSRWRARLEKGLVTDKPGSTDELQDASTTCTSDASSVTTPASSSEAPAETRPAGASADVKGLCNAVLAPFSDFYCCKMELVTCEPTPLADVKEDWPQGARDEFSRGLATRLDAAQSARPSQKTPSELGEALRERHSQKKANTARQLCQTEVICLEDVDKHMTKTSSMPILSQQAILPARFPLASQRGKKPAVAAESGWNEEIFNDVNVDPDVSLNLQRLLQLRSNQMQGIDVPLVLPPLTEMLMCQVRQTRHQRYLGVRRISPQCPTSGLPGAECMDTIDAALAPCSV